MKIQTVREPLRNGIPDVLHLGASALHHTFYAVKRWTNQGTDDETTNQFAIDVAHDTFFCRPVRQLVPNDSQKTQSTQASGSSEQSQTQPASAQGQVSSQAGAQTVTGCLVQSDDGYALKTENDTYPLDTDKDLSQFVGKRINVRGDWEHHQGVAAPASSGNASAASNDPQQQPSSGQAEKREQPSSDQSAPSHALAAHFHVRVIATVVGDCSQPKQ